MAFLQVQFFSETLRQGCSMNVILPERYHRPSEPFVQPYPVLYLLHGASDDHSAWQRNTSIEQYAAEKGIAVIMPSVQYSFYSDMKHGYDYFTYIAEELPQIVKSFFPISERREDTFAIGLSMGGYGAFKLGVSYPQRYAAVASLSGSLDQRTRLEGKALFNNTVFSKQAMLTFGSYEEYVGSDNNIGQLLERRLAEGVTMPSFYQACGTNDHNYEINQSFHEIFHNRINLLYEVESGAGHDWEFWDKYVRRAVDWLPLRK
ncbi:alpha/beta hydrolase family protein [Paenibacillus lupini]|uniref:alpha/beta hydrolase n=1 Tax=Paenibacillus lupini TaxID=1450204 RepID=UPI001420B512|nr:alpha/beta hydrolase family protein [Paenibacillus lupini]NIK22157.1 S-formylglutathione hydrolase FrmB [Paenibacillus lupini]